MSGGSPVARDLWVALLAQAGRQGPLTVKRKFLDECEPDQVQQAKDLGVLGEPDVARQVTDPRYGDDLLDVDFTDEGPVLITPADSPETDVRVGRERLERYPVSLEALFAELAKANKLTGKPRCLTCGLWLLGRRTSGGRTAAVCLVPAGLRGPVRQVLREARDELVSAPLTVLLPPEHTLDAAAASELRGMDILPLALEDRLEAGLRLDLGEVRAFTGAADASGPVLHVDARKRFAVFGGVPLALPKSAFNVLRHYAARPGEVLSYEEVCEAVGEPSFGASKWMCDRVSEIRRALSAAIRQGSLNCPPPRDLLANSRGTGYRLNLPANQTDFVP